MIGLSVFTINTGFHDCATYYLLPALLYFVGVKCSSISCKYFNSHSFNFSMLTVYLFTMKLFTFVGILLVYPANSESIQCMNTIHVLLVPFFLCKINKYDKVK